MALSKLKENAFDHKPMGIRAMIALAVEFYTRNVEANRASTDAEHARTRLYAAMINAGRAVLPFKLGPLPLEAVIETRARRKIDPRKFRELVGENAFWECVKINQKDAERVAGKNVVAQCLVDDDDCPENVYVKAKSVMDR